MLYLSDLDLSCRHIYNLHWIEEQMLEGSEPQIPNETHFYRLTECEYQAKEKNASGYTSSVCVFQQ